MEGKRLARCCGLVLATAVVALYPSSSSGAGTASASRPTSPNSASISMSAPRKSEQSSSLSSPPSTSAITTTAQSTPASGASLSETVEVAIQPGNLSIHPGTQTVVFGAFASRDPSASDTSLRGDLTPVTVVDGRGTLAGWHVTVTFDGLYRIDRPAVASSAASVCVFPSRPVLVFGNPIDVVERNSSSCLAVGASAGLFFAAPGGGGGTYEDGAVLELHVPKSMGGDRFSAMISLSVA